ncbi:ATP-binding protein [Alteromonas sp. ASW11-19]|uniref:histidine kinase n=1 Tax=Alteromonas salexigens TaxID=2982530 RepID=A0ABT2VQX4_9ALTE|nr:ATP-binding protein [Alteromonas salexigens]MCU7555287.1 ATP-binding protein [Alteromonas salexigens]
MKGLSLRLRSLLVAIIALGLFIPATVLTLERAYTTSLTQAKLNELKLMSLALVSAFELDGDIPYMPELLYEEQLNLPDSGYVGMIAFRDKVVWQSASALNFTITSPPPAPPVGEVQFTDDYRASFDDAQQYFAYTFSAEFAASNDFEPVRFYIFNDKQEFNAERDAFVDTVWQWMLLLSLGLLVLIVVGINVVLAPVRKLISEIHLTARGEQRQLAASYPSEFDSLKRSINHLLQAEAEQRARYKNSLGDLAHSLKTPLAVALGARPLPGEAEEALGQINQLIQRQLKRASAGKSGWQTPIAIAPLVNKLFNAMKKVHRDKQLSFRLNADNNATFAGDHTDLMEVLGNLIDNASKAARSGVWVTVKREGHWLTLLVDDDGPGIPPAQKERLLLRGERLDAYQDGQGIGMAVVSDLVAIYEGQLSIQDAPQGGARIQLRFPR